ncbi:hypothetical protein [Streptomyces sp. NPDC097619]|uniref:hypothetical protein n=1 Tax=Streptomyces sp. NPDC097619 TaxID=3157228 RepID=UPI00332A13E6
MDLQAMEDARQWLAQEGVTQVGEDEWTDGGSPPGRLTSSEVAVAWADQVFADERLDDAGSLRLAFGLLDLLDAYGVTVPIGFALRDPEFGVPIAEFWEAYRGRLEAPEACQAVTYSLWVDWFEDPTTSAGAFIEVLGNDAELLCADAPVALLRRAERVLENSGPVRWSVKERAYRAAAEVPALHPAVFAALLHSYHDIYGDLEPEPALVLLEGLDLRPDTEHLAVLRTVLAAGHRNHYSSPDAWTADAVTGGGAGAGAGAGGAGEGVRDGGAGGGPGSGDDIGGVGLGAGGFGAEDRSVFVRLRAFRRRALGSFLKPSGR